MNPVDATVVVRIAGEGGEGTITLGDLFTQIAAASGLEVYSFRTYPAEIKGGQVMYQTRLGVDRVMTEGDEANVLVAMNQQAWVDEHTDLCKHAAIIHEATVRVPASRSSSLRRAGRGHLRGTGLAPRQELRAPGCADLVLPPRSSDAVEDLVRRPHGTSP